MSMRGFLGSGLSQLLAIVETVCIVCPPEAWDSTMSALAVLSYSSISLHETLVAGSQCVVTADSVTLAICKMSFAVCTYV